MHLPRIIIATLALAVISAPVLAGSKVNVCHKSDEGDHTIKISSKALKAHLGHGDTTGECPVVPVYDSVVMIRCLNDELGAVTVSGSSVSDNAVLPDGLVLTLDPPSSCANAVAHMMNNEYSLKQVSSGGTDMGLETEYLFIGESNYPVVTSP